MSQRWRRRPIRVALAVVAAAALVGCPLVVGRLVWAPATVSRSQASAAWVDALVPQSRTAGIQAVLDRRAAAVRARDRAAFLADVDTSDEDFVRKQGIVYDNLVKLPLAELVFQVEQGIEYPRSIPMEVKTRFGSAVYAPGVTIRYRVDGVDPVSLAAPWVPIFGYSRSRQWLIIGQSGEQGLPYGVNGQAWDGGPIVVARSAHVVVVSSAEDSRRGDYILKLAESGLERVKSVRRDGWNGQVLVTAVQDQRIFEGYFATAPDRVANVAAIAVPYYEQVADWSKDPKFAATRVVFNPRQLSAQPEELAHDLAHEFTHAAMGPVTSRSTPRWLVEGFAEYVAYRGDQMSSSTLRRLLRDVTPGETLPQDDHFYSDMKNYVTSWFACRMIAEKYGEKQLLALYESFQKQASQDTNIRAVLGISNEVLTAEWRGYVNRYRG